MKLGVISDTHDRVEMVSAALEEFGRRSVERIIHCGDIESTETVRAFDGWSMDFVFGNCDWRTDALRLAVAEIGGRLHEPFGELEIADQKIAWVHGHISALKQELETSGRYDYLFYGHTHCAELHLNGCTRIINPGALHRVQVKSCLVVDLASGELESVTLQLPTK
jgi:putative phosphoesterase